MTLLNPLLFALIFACIGRYNHRWLPITIAGLLLVWRVSSIPLLLAYGWLFFIVRIVPTHGLFSSIHGEYPTRTDDKWDFLRRCTNKLWHLFPEIKLLDNYYFWGILYGLVRASLAIPAMIYIGGWSYLFLLHGAIYYVAGRISQRYSVRIAECVSGAIYGACII